jgi:ATP-dependent Clp protease ATP-binding subunit ClpC
MFERFTERSRQAVVHSQDEARRLGHDYIGTEHLLLGLLREQQGIAAAVLDGLGLTLEDARASVEAAAGFGAGTPSGQIPFTPRAKQTLELALRESMALRHDYIGTEHILLALGHLQDSVAARILTEAGLDRHVVRSAVVERIASGQATPVPQRARWEYTTEDVEEVTSDVLQGFGDEGWELVTALPLDGGYRLVLKRRP